MKAIVVYKSRYGASEQYARWLAEGLACGAERVETVGRAALTGCDVVLYVGGLYAGKVNGFDRVKPHLDALDGKPVVLCMVGMTNPAEWEVYEQAYRGNVPEQYRPMVKPFALRGAQMFSRMSLLHRAMMRVPKLIVKRKPEAERTEEDRRMLESFGKDVSFVARENIREIVDYVNGLSPQQGVAQPHEGIGPYSLPR